MSEPSRTLSDSLFSYLQHERFVLLHTIDAETSGPTSSVISWVYAADPGRIRMALDASSRLVANMKANNRVALTIFAAGAVNAVYGRASEVTDSLEDVPFRMACFDVHITEVRNALFYGARMAMEPEIEKTYDRRAAAKLDQQVFAAMRKA